MTTLAESLSAVLLGEILDQIRRRPEPIDPRLDALITDDWDHPARLRDSVAAYLAEHGDVQKGRAPLSVHPSPERYRLRKAETLMGVELSNALGRLLTELQLALDQRRPSAPRTSPRR